MADAHDAQQAAERLVEYAASEAYEEAVEELIAIDVEVDKVWRQYIRGIITTNEFVTAALPSLNKMHELLVQIEEQGFGSGD